MKKRPVLAQFNFFSTTDIFFCTECHIPMCSQQCAVSSIHTGQECQLLKKLDLKISPHDAEGHIIYCVSANLGRFLLYI